MIAIFGGSFDPPHLGHRNIVQSILNSYPEIDKIWIIPNFQSPLKGQKYLPRDLIWKFCLENFSNIDHSRVQVLPLEWEKEKPSYTWETVQTLKDTHPTERFCLLVGFDLLQTWKDWYKVQELQNLLDQILVFPRKNYQTAKDLDSFLNSNSWILEQHKFRWFSTEVIEISSREIRSNPELGKQYMLPLIFEEFFRWFQEPA